MPGIHRITASILCLVSLAACSGDGGDGPWLPDSTRFEATWQPGVAVMDQASVVQTLLNPDTTDGVYRFAPGTAVIQSLQPDQPLLLAGFDVVYAKAIEVQSDAIVVTTAPASLTALVEDGEVAWDMGIDFQEQDAAPSALSMHQAFLTSGGHLLDNAKLSYDGPLGPFQFTGRFVPGNGSLGVKGVVSLKSNNSVLKIDIDGTLKRFRHTGDLIIRGNKLEAFQIRIDDLDVDLTLELGAVEVKTGDSVFKVPIEVVLPFNIGLVPVYLTLGLQVNVNAKLATQSSSRGKARFRIKGSTGFRYDAQGIETLGSLDDYSLDFSQNEAVSVVDSGIGFVAEFPKIGIGLGNPKLKAAIGGYTTLKTEIVANMTMRYEAAGPVPVITGNCYEVTQNFGMYAGGEMRLAGIKFSQETPLYTKVTRPVRKGDACK